MNSHIVFRTGKSHETPDGNIQAREYGRAATADVFRNGTLSVGHLSSLSERFQREGHGDIVARMDTFVRS